MAVRKGKRLSQIAKELNVGIQHLVDFLAKKGQDVSSNPNTKISLENYELLQEKFSKDKSLREALEEKRRKREAEAKQKVEKATEQENTAEQSEDTAEETVIIQGINSHNEPETVQKEDDTKETTESEIVEETEKTGLKVVGKIDLDKTVSDSGKETKKEPELIEKEPIKEADDTNEPETEDIKNIDSVNEDNKPEEENSSEDVTESKIVEEKTVSEEKTEKISADSEPSQEDKKPIKVLGKIDLDSLNQKVRPNKKKTSKERREERQKREEASKLALEKAKLERKQQEDEKLKKEAEIKAEKTAKEKEQKVSEDFIETKVTKLSGPTVVGKIELKEPSKTDKNKKKHESRRKKRKRIRKPVDKKQTQTPNKRNSDSNKKNSRRGDKRPKKQEVATEDVNAQVKQTLAKLTGKSKKKAVKHRREKRKEIRQKIQDHQERQEQEKGILKVTEFISANEFASMMDVSVNEVIQTSFELGKMVTINSRLDAELISIIGEEYGFQVEFISATDTEIEDTYEDKEEDLVPRPPIVTVMGHVDHGKTSLLDFIRNANVIEGEAGGITQHIGAYSVKVGENQITFLDTPGHEAFTAMRARGAKVTDIAIIIVAADDNIMPQTEEAINHAKAADVPIVFAINKIDKDGANPDRIKQELAERDLLIEEWGGKYQSADISAKHGTNVDKLLEEVVLAAEMLELKANPKRPAKGTVIEASLDKGRGYMTTVLVQTGTLKIGDVILAGSNSGKVKAMFNEHNQRVTEAGPSEPVLILGLDGAPQAGDMFYVMKSEKEARDIAAKNKRLIREQSMRAHKHITLDEIGRRLKLGGFQQLNVIIKGDVIGSIEAIADSLIKLSTEEIELNVIHKAVGQISEADVMLAAASDAIIIGFQVRPSVAARKLAETEEVDIRLYHIIYDAISEIKDAMEGMLSPEIKEEITATIEVREVFKITKVGNVAGCYVLDGKVNRDDKVRLIRDGIVVYSGKLGSLKRFKDDVKEVNRGYECGLNLYRHEDIKVGDIIEAYQEVEVAKKLV